MLTRKKIAQNNVTTGAGAGLRLRSQLYISVTGLQSLVFGCTIVIIQPSWSHIKVSFLMKQSSSTAIWAKWTGGSSNREQGGGCQLSRWAGGHQLSRCVYVYLLYLCSCSFNIFVMMVVKMSYTRGKDATFKMLTIQILAGPHQTARLSALEENAAWRWDKFETFLHLSYPPQHFT